MMIPQNRAETTIIQRVLNLRKQMEIDNELSTVDPRDSISSPAQMEASKHSTKHPYFHNGWQWIPWPKDA
jgi:hypothetical protein